MYAEAPPLVVFQSGMCIFPGRTKRIFQVLRLQGKPSLCTACIKNPSFKHRKPRKSGVPESPCFRSAAAFLFSFLRRGSTAPAVLHNLAHAHRAERRTGRPLPFRALTAHALSCQRSPQADRLGAKGIPASRIPHTLRPSSQHLFASLYRTLNAIRLPA